MITLKNNSRHQIDPPLAYILLGLYGGRGEFGFFLFGFGFVVTRFRIVHLSVTIPPIPCNSEVAHETGACMKSSWNACYQEEVVQLPCTVNIHLDKDML